jgi:hypothetical protein
MRGPVWGVPREEPSARIAHARVCEGRGWPAMVAATRARSRKRWIRAKRTPYGRDQFSPTRSPEGRWFESSRPDSPQTDSAGLLRPAGRDGRRHCDESRYITSNYLRCHTVCCYAWAARAGFEVCIRFGTAVEDRSWRRWVGATSSPLRFGVVRRLVVAVSLN